MTGEWFHCGLCEIDFQDPYAPENNGMVYGQCPECVRTIERLTNEEFERRFDRRNNEEDRPEKALSAFLEVADVGGDRQ